MYKVVDYGTYYAISTWTKVDGVVLASFKTIEEAKDFLKTVEVES